MLTEEIVAIKLLVGKVTSEEVLNNPNALNEAVGKGISKILEHYQLGFMLTGFQWINGGQAQYTLALAPLSQPVKKDEKL